MHRIFVCAALASTLFVTSACSLTLPSFYKTKIRQGNYLEQSALNSLHAGMTRTQVQALMGSPLLTDPFHQNRWDYVYIYRPGTYDDGEPEERHVTLFFDGEVLSRIEYAKP